MIFGSVLTYDEGLLGTTAPHAGFLLCVMMLRFWAIGGFAECVGYHSEEGLVDDFYFMGYGMCMMIDSEVIIMFC